MAAGRSAIERFAPIGAVGTGMVTGVLAFQAWVGLFVPGSKELADYYDGRVFPADYFKNIANMLQNPLTQERPISLMDPSYGLVAMTALEAAVLWGTVVVALGVLGRGNRDATRLARSAIGAIVLGALALFYQGALRGLATSSTNTRYLLPVVPFMFGAIAMTVNRLWARRSAWIPSVVLPVWVALVLAVQVVAVDHTAEPRLNNAWTRRQTGVLASFINDEVTAGNGKDGGVSPEQCIHKGDTVAVVPFMPALYAMTRDIKAPENAESYWVGTLPRKVRKQPFEMLNDSDIDVVIISSPLYVAYERSAAAHIAAEWPRCARWMPLGLGLTHPPFEVYVRPTKR